MPIEYSVSGDGHFINAVASGHVTAQEFIEYELNHAVDKRIRAPLSELLVIEPGAFRQITTGDISRIIEYCRRASIKQQPMRILPFMARRRWIRISTIKATRFLTQ